MPVLVNLRHLEKKNVLLDGELAEVELELGERPDELVYPASPVRYDLEVERQAENLLVSGSLELSLRCECARCLKPYDDVVRLEPWDAIVPLVGDDASPVDNDCVDLTPFIREDIVLAFPQHPLCKKDCAGLPRAGSDKEAESKGDFSLETETSTAWAALNKLKF